MAELPSMWSPTPVYGWRYWHPTPNAQLAVKNPYMYTYNDQTLWNDSGYLLPFGFVWSGVAGHCWDSPEKTAACNFPICKTPFQEGNAPHPNGTCGIYAYKTSFTDGQVADIAKWHSGTGLALIGLVEMTGRIIEHEWGYRAEKVKCVAAFVPTEPWVTPVYEPVYVIESYEPVSYLPTLKTELTGCGPAFFGVELDPVFSTPWQVRRGYVPKQPYPQFLKTCLNIISTNTSFE
jgi:hypothetical protein